jgi:hypothetical protein
MVMTTSETEKRWVNIVCCFDFQSQPVGALRNYLLLLWRKWESGLLLYVPGKDQQPAPARFASRRFKSTQNGGGGGPLFVERHVVFGFVGRLFFGFEGRRYSSALREEDILTDHG